MVVVFKLCNETKRTSVNDFIHWELLGLGKVAEHDD